MNIFPISNQKLFFWFCHGDDGGHNEKLGEKIKKLSVMYQMLDKWSMLYVEKQKVFHSGSKNKLRIFKNPKWRENFKVLSRINARL